jgi:hypothetical protein
MRFGWGVKGAAREVPILEGRSVRVSASGLAFVFLVKPGDDTGTRSVEKQLVSDAQDFPALCYFLCYI